MWLPCYSISGGARPWLLVVGAIAVVARIATPTSAFYLPGLAPQDYKEGDLVPLHVNSITPSSGDTVRKPESVVSYSFYDSRFHFCQPPGNPQPVNEWLGSILFGDRIFTSAFEIRMLKVENCKLLCASSIPQDDASFVARRISEGYSFNWLLDGLPVAMQRQGERVEDTSYSIGFEMGREDVEAEQGEVGRPSIYNHYDLTVEYHT
ncbi:Transmembrane 9 super member 2, partial [Spiromyces aspiralis]